MILNQSYLSQLVELVGKIIKSCFSFANLGLSSWTYKYTSKPYQNLTIFVMGC